jgi:hypothetical protein
LRFIGLTGNVLLAPAWAIGMGTSLLRSPERTRGRRAGRAVRPAG